MIVHCSYCCDQYDPVEYREVVDPDEPHFCSSDCEEAYWASLEFASIYSAGRYGGASVF